MLSRVICWDCVCMCVCDCVLVFDNWECWKWRRYCSRIGRSKWEIFWFFLNWEFRCYFSHKIPISYTSISSFLTSHIHIHKPPQPSPTFKLLLSPSPLFHTITLTHLPFTQLPPNNSQPTHTGQEMSNGGCSISPHPWLSSPFHRRISCLWVGGACEGGERGRGRGLWGRSSIVWSYVREKSVRWEVRKIILCSFQSKFASYRPNKQHLLSHQSIKQPPAYLKYLNLFFLLNFISPSFFHPHTQSQG